MSQLPRPVQFQLVVLGPLLFGLVCGFFLGISAASWWVANALAIAAGMLGGAEQAAAPARTTRPRDARREAAVRGAVTGAMFGVGVVIAHAASGDPAHAPLPSPEVLFIPFSALVATGLATLGAVLAARRT